MRALLKIADALEESDEELKVWLKQVREIVYETEDALDKYRLIQAHNQCHGLGLYGYLHKFSCRIKSMKARSRIISELNCINSSIKNISEVHERLRPKFTRAEQGSGITMEGNTWEYRRGDALLLDKTNLLGIDERKQQLVEWLVKGGYGREVVSVAAMRGMGKTTLAKQVYDDPEVKKHFKRRAWITVSQSFKMEELLRDMIHQIYSVVSRPVPEGLDSMNKDRLRRIVKDLLQKRRYLIVLDDVWHLYEWDALKYAMPNNNCGSRIILTTRNIDVASSSGVESVGKVYNLKPLTPEESWQLFSRKTFQGDACPSYLKEICQYTLRKCEGLPLAIVLISGVLATKDKRRTDEWNMVGRSLGAEIDGNYLKKVLSLSFNHLPFYLRSCFLYLIIFPEHCRIEQMRVIRLWIAEGFIEAKEWKTLEEVAEDYLNELLNRGLLQVAGTTTNGRVKLYRVQDLLREIIMSKARDQNFTSIAKDHNMTRPDKVTIYNRLDLFEEIFEKLRSPDDFLIFQ
ncbi:hypothetical protein F2P56_027180, partial [Juglans regia]|uniref:Disease resistance protein RPP13-like n=2 Tax=Juglans regia TaxID=51240 RepID=A0A2I4F5Y8_JUGRE